MQNLAQILSPLRELQSSLLSLNSTQKNAVLKDMSEELRKNSDYIISQNQIDIQNAKNAALSNAMIKRLELDKKAINSIISSLESVISLPDPIGITQKGWHNKDGLNIQKISIPIGVVGVIYESRPNVSVEVASLCFKSSNICVLKGGKEAMNSNLAIVASLKKALIKNGIDERVITFLQISRDEVANLLKMDKFIDVLVPRGGSSLVSFVAQNSTIPVIKHDKGMCHIFVDESVDIDSAIKICINAKCQKPSACNSAETLLVHKNIAGEFLPKFKAKFDEFGGEIFGDEITISIISCQKADIKSYKTEYLDYKINIKVVQNLQDALNHIAKFSSNHSEAILTNSTKNAEIFSNIVDSACVYINASTRFSDGYEFGFGAELGISTNKLHARGPMGLNELTTYKYVVAGNGQIRK
ncbi:MAG: glutamate-5-semialdehyde dehydrogenase [Campylobacter sp.]|nr:glutamate-5-semialdehyde dehydrogenase [Campylobacter sp.]